jgi:hypothetical protein
MACTRENPCGGILYEDPQGLELARAGIHRRVEKCLAGHSFWQGELPDLTRSGGARVDDVTDDDVASAATGRNRPAKPPRNSLRRERRPTTLAAALAALREELA